MRISSHIDFTLGNEKFFKVKKSEVAKHFCFSFVLVFLVENHICSIRPPSRLGARVRRLGMGTIVKVAV